MFGEAIQGIRVIKSYGWEDSFMERIAAIRKSESVELLINQRAMAVLLPIAVAIPALASGVTFVLRVVINGDACAHCCLCVSLTHVSCPSSGDLPAGGSSFLAAGYFACLSTPLIILPFGLSNLSQVRHRTSSFR